MKSISVLIFVLLGCQSLPNASADVYPPTAGEAVYGEGVGDRHLIVAEEEQLPAVVQQDLEELRAAADGRLGGRWDPYFSPNGRSFIAKRTVSPTAVWLWPDWQTAEECFEIRDMDFSWWAGDSYALFYEGVTTFLINVGDPARRIELPVAQLHHPSVQVVGTTWIARSWPSSAYVGDLGSTEYWQVEQTLPAEDPGYIDVALLRNGQLAAVATQADTVALWDIKERRLIEASLPGRIMRRLADNFFYSGSAQSRDCWIARLDENRLSRDTKCEGFPFATSPSGRFSLQQTTQTIWGPVRIVAPTPLATGEESLPPISPLSGSSIARGFFTYAAHAHDGVAADDPVLGSPAHEASTPSDAQPSTPSDTQPTADAAIFKDAQAREVLEQMADFYKAMTTIRGEVSAEAELLQPPHNEYQLIRSRFSIAAKRPNLLALRLLDGQMGSTVVSDGKQLGIYYAGVHGYTVQEAPASIAEIAEWAGMMQRDVAGAGALLFAMFAFAEDPLAAFGRYVTEVEHRGTEVIDGEEAHKLHMTTIGQSELMVWIATGKEPLPIAMSTLPATSQNGEKPSMRRVVVSFEKMAAGVDLEEEIFVFTPPEGARKGEPMIPRGPQGGVLGRRRGSVRGRERNGRPCTRWPRATGACSAGLPARPSLTHWPGAADDRARSGDGALASHPATQ